MLNVRACMVLDGWRRVRGAWLSVGKEGRRLGGEGGGEC